MKMKIMTQFGMTPLHALCIRNEPEFTVMCLARLLLENGADLGIGVGAVRGDGGGGGG